MFPLNTQSFPVTGAELAQRLNTSLRDLFALTRDPVQLREKSYPHLDSMAVTLDGAELRDRPPGMPFIIGAAQPALTIDSFRITASPFLVGPASVEFELAARNVNLHRATERDGRLLLLLHNAAEGRVEISLAVADLEELIAEVARAEAGKHGVNIDRVELTLRSRGPRSLTAEIGLRVKKLFLSATIRVTGQLDLDEQLNAKVSGLVCLGEGAVASVACGVLKPHLEKLDGRKFSLMSLPLGEVRLHDVRIAAGERLSITAEFGSARG